MLSGGKQNEWRFEKLNDKERIAGEWLMQVHSIRYEIDCMPFVAFDYFDCNNNRKTFKELLNYSYMYDIVTPRIVYADNMAYSIHNSMYEVNNFKYRHPIQSIDSSEGVVYRIERKGKFDFAAKYVRNDFEPGKYLNLEKPIYNINPNEL